MPAENPYDLVIETVCRGGVGVLPTDTLYGIVGSALQSKTVKKIYRLRKRNPKKPMIILIGSLDDVRQFGVALTPAVEKILKKVWPGKVSVILPMGANGRGKAAVKKFHYLHRGTKTLAFRLPTLSNLKNFLKKTGPLVVPSANFEGKTPARTIKEAKHYFGDRISFYIDAGKLMSKPSTLIAIDQGKVLVLRKGAVNIH